VKEGWTNKQLGKVISLEYGKPLPQEDRDEKGLYPAYGANGVKSRTNKHYCDKKSIVVGRKGSAGEINITEEKFWPLDVTFYVEFDESEYSLMFIYYYLKLLNLPSLAKGVKPGINRNDVYALYVNIPSLEEQKRIVGILDEAFEGIDKAISTTEQNLYNTRNIYTSFRNNVFNKLKNSYSKATLGKLIATLTDYHANGSYKILKENVTLYNEENYAWMVRSTDFENSFKNDKRYITKEAHEFLKKSQLFGNELIMSKIGNAGKTYIMPKVNMPCSLAMNLFLIRLNDTVALNKFVYHYLQTSEGDTQIKSKLRGVATQTITKDSVRELIIPTPPVEIQKQILDKLDSLTPEIEQLESIYHNKLRALSELKQSLLKKAFEGEL